MTDFVQGDTGSSIQFTCIDSNNYSPMNLAIYTATINWRNSSNTLITRSMQKHDSANGILRYTFGTGELVAGTMKFDIILTNINTNQYITSRDVISIDVRKRL